MAKFELAEPFDIDDGSLGGLDPKLIFCLGVEWQMFRATLDTESDAFEMDCHAPNADRLLAMCARRGRKARKCWLHEDHPEWAKIVVE